MVAIPSLFSLSHARTGLGIIAVMANENSHSWTRYWRGVFVSFLILVGAIDAALVIGGQAGVMEALIGTIPLLVVFACVWRLMLPWFEAADRHDG